MLPLQNMVVQPPQEYNGSSAGCYRCQCDHYVKKVGANSHQKCWWCVQVPLKIDLQESSRDERKTKKDSAEKNALFVVGGGLAWFALI